MNVEFKPLPSVDRLRELFNYNPQTGDLTWKVVDGSKSSDGNCRSIRNNGRYYGVRIDGESYLVHRVIMKLMTGHDPADVIEHIDDNGLNNRFDNLVESTQPNNIRTYYRNTNGTVKGYKLLPNGRFYSSIRIDNSEYNLGTYDTAEEATEAYLSAARQFNENTNWRPSKLIKTTNNRTGFKHVQQRGNKFAASYSVKRKNIYVGLFDTAFEAYSEALAHKLENDLTFPLDLAAAEVTPVALKAPSIG